MDRWHTLRSRRYLLAREPRVTMVYVPCYIMPSLFPTCTLTSPTDLWYIRSRIILEVSNLFRVFHRSHLLFISHRGPKLISCEPLGWGECLRQLPNRRDTATAHIASLLPPWWIHPVNVSLWSWSLCNIIKLQSVQLARLRYLILFCNLYHPAPTTLLPHPAISSSHHHSSKLH